jgi:hypothetical protein
VKWWGIVLTFPLLHYCYDRLLMPTG